MDLITTFCEGFIDPRKRVCLLYLGSALVIGIFWLVLCQGKSFRDAVTVCLSKETWWSVSARQDYLLLFLNKVFSIIIANVWLSSTVATFAIFELLHEIMPARPHLDINPTVVVVLFTFSLFVLDDFTKYLVHWLLHNIRCLWAFHKVHHSATSLTPFTIFRTHPVEVLLFSARSAVVRAVLIATFIFFLGEGVDLLTVLGVNVALFAFHFLGSNLRHSHVYLPYWDWLERWLISPAQHQLHHSKDPQHHGKNLGIALAVWDRLGGTLMIAPRKGGLLFGFSNEEQKKIGTLKYVYLGSFLESFRNIYQPLCNFLYKRPVKNV